MTKYQVEVFLRLPRAPDYVGRSLSNTVEVWADTKAEARLFAIQNVTLGLSNAEVTAAKVTTLGLVR